MTPVREGKALAITAGPPEEAPSPIVQQAPNAAEPKRVALDAQQASTTPDWLSHFPQATDQSGSGSPFSSYTASAPAKAVLTYYQDLLHQANIASRAGFNGIGTTILASSQEQFCVIRISEGDRGTNVGVKCGPQTGEPRAEFGLSRFPAPGPTLPPGAHHIEYAINGSAGKAGVTYRNASGGTEQNDLNLPASLSFDATGRMFVYLSAQNKSGEGNVHVAITIDGQLLQEATSSTKYGIATASGSVPR